MHWQLAIVVPIGMLQKVVWLAIHFEKRLFVFRFYESLERKGIVELAAPKQINQNFFGGLNQHVGCKRILLGNYQSDGSVRDVSDAILFGQPSLRFASF